MVGNLPRNVLPFIAIVTETSIFILWSKHSLHLVVISVFLVKQKIIVFI